VIEMIGSDAFALKKSGSIKIGADKKLSEVLFLIVKFKLMLRSAKERWPKKSVI
jgi:hypothetical protein